MRMLVTGSRGYVGAVLVSMLRAEGHEVVRRGVRAEQRPRSEDGDAVAAPVASLTAPGTGSRTGDR